MPGRSPKRSVVLACLARRPSAAHAMTGRSWLIRWYYDKGARLPEVQRGLFGRGVVGVSAAGYQRIAHLPPLLADDLAASLAFSQEERVIVPNAHVVVHPPRAFADLLRSRTRADGADQIERAEAMPSSTARTRPADLLRIASHNPRLTPRVVLFLAVGLLARRKARRVTARSGYSTWLRDDSSRTEAAADAR